MVKKVFSVHTIILFLVESKVFYTYFIFLYKSRINFHFLETNYVNLFLCYVNLVLNVYS